MRAVCQTGQGKCKGNSGSGLFDLSRAASLLPVRVGVRPQVNVSGHPTSVCATECTLGNTVSCFGREHRRALGSDASTRRSRLLGPLGEIPFLTQDG
jgi:hypothetical protein